MDLNEQLKGWLMQQAQPGSFLDKAGLGLARAGQTIGQDAAAGAAIMNDPRNSWIGMNPVGKMAASGLGMAGMLLGQISPKAVQGFDLGKALLKGGATTKPMKNIWDMTSDELIAGMEAKAKADAGIYKEVLGDKADEFLALEKRLERTQNFSDTPGYQKAEQRYNELLDSITPEQQNRMFGVGEKDPQVTDFRAFQRALEDVNGETPQELGQSISRAITEVGKETDPTKMTQSQQIAYAQIRHAFEQATELGWDTKDVSRAAVAASARRFSDPEDALFMLERYLKKPDEGGQGLNLIPRGTP